jgi:RNA-directed DNA polymerase
LASVRLGEAFRAHVVSYADDFVILSRGRAVEALAWTKAVMIKLGLTINEAKTSLKDAREDRFDFLGYSFGPICYKGTRKWYLSASPSKKSVQRLKVKASNLLVPANTEPWPEVLGKLNSMLQGWSNYFCHGTRRAAYRAIDSYVYERVRNFLVRRHKVAGRGTRRFSCEAVYGLCGRLQAVKGLSHGCSIGRGSHVFGLT